MRKKSILFPVLGGCAISCAALAAETQAAVPPKPNILVIVADDLGYGELSCQGFTKQVPTPNIDSIAANGVRFTSGYVSGPYCSPTRAGFMTGRYQQRYGHEYNPGRGPDIGLSLDEKTIGDRLKPAGYATGWFGKSHLGFEPKFHPLKRGFDEFFGFLDASHDYLDAATDSDNPIMRGTTPVDNIGYTTEAFGNEASNFIEKHKDEPWLCYLAFNAVHSPLESTEKYLSRFVEVKDSKRRTFCAMLSAMDDAVGAVMAKVRELNLEENTLVIFFSDNGGPTGTTSGNGPLRGVKAQTWEGGIRIPFMIQWKGRIPAGKVDERPVIQLDILPTALAAAGVAVQPEWKLDGVNLLPYLTGENSDAPHDVLYWRFGPQMAIRMGDWKLVKGVGISSIKSAKQPGKASTDGAELYNVKEDIGEKNNLASKEPAKVKELVAAWQKWNSELIDPKWYPSRADPGKSASGSKKKAGGDDSE